MAKRKIMKIKLSDNYWGSGYESYYHKRGEVISGYLHEDGNFRVQERSSRRSYLWLVPPQYCTIMSKPLILISVESEDTRKEEPQAQNKQ